MYLRDFWCVTFQVYTNHTGKIYDIMYRVHPLPGNVILMSMKSCRSSTKDERFIKILREERCYSYREFPNKNEWPWFTPADQED